MPDPMPCPVRRDEMAYQAGLDAAEAREAARAVVVAEKAAHLLSPEHADEVAARCMEGGGEWAAEAFSAALSKFARTGDGTKLRRILCGTARAMAEELVDETAVSRWLDEAVDVEAHS